MTPIHDDLRLAAACRDIGRTEPFAVDGSRAPEEALAPVLAHAVHASRASIVITDAALDPPGPRIVYVNPAFEAMTGYAAADAVGRDPRFLQGPATSRSLLDRLRGDLQRDGRFEGEAVNYRADGTPFVMSWRIGAVHDDAGVPTHYVAIQDDVTEERVRALDASVLVADLQRLGLPDVPERVGGLEVATGYRPARAGLPIGGDWYDAVATADGGVVLVAGDVAGHGAESVVTMGMLRWTIAALLSAGAPLEQVAAVAHRAAVSARVHASVALAHVFADGDTRVLTAGHPPVVILDDRGAFRPVLTPNPMLGVGRVDAWSVVRATLGRDETMILLTDGVVAGGRIDVDAIPADVATRVGTRRAPDAVCDALLSTTPDGDDAAVIAARAARP
jgi:PAS domain S-box-containing protein